MPGDPRPWPGGFLSPLLANMLAPVVRSVSRALTATMMERPDLTDVTCPKCGAVVAVWASLTGCLYEPGGRGHGAPLSADRRARVPVRCGRCRVTRYTSGQAVGRHLRGGRPLLS